VSKRRTKKEEQREKRKEKRRESRKKGEKFAGDVGESELLPPVFYF